MYNAYILDPNRRGYDAHMYDDMISMILDPDTCMYDAFIYVPRSLILMHVCMMHISMILDLYLCICFCICVFACLTPGNIVFGVLLVLRASQNIS